jgi:hypothetical protein
METIGNLGKWIVVCFLVAVSALALYMGRYFSSVICDIPAARYLLLLGLGVLGLMLVEMYSMCVVNGHGAHETLDSKKPKGSKVVSIGRTALGFGFVLCLAIVNVSMYFSNTCERTSGESAAAKLNLQNFRTLYEALRTILSILDFMCLILGLFFVWKKCDDVSGDEAGTEEERLPLAETNRSAMEAHHAKA